MFIEAKAQGTTARRKIACFPGCFQISLKTILFFLFRTHLRLKYLLTSKCSKTMYFPVTVTQGKNQVIINEGSLQVKYIMYLTRMLKAISCILVSDLFSCSDMSSLKILTFRETEYFQVFIFFETGFHFLCSG